MFLYEKYYLKDGDNIVQSIVVTCDELSYNQNLNFSETNTPDIPTATFGFALDDYNFDGFLDISLWKYEGGTLMNNPTYYWIWNNELHEYKSCEQLEIISEDYALELDKKNQHISAFCRYPDGSYIGFYKWVNDIITLFKTDEIRYNDYNSKTGKGKIHHVVKELENGKMQITDEYNED